MSGLSLPGSGLSITGTATAATNLAGGSANQIPVQTAPNTTSFIAAPTTGGTVLTWNGSAFVWSAPGLVSGASTISGGTSSGILWNNAGVLAAGPALSDATGNVTAVAAASFSWIGRSLMQSPSDGIITLLNNAGTTFSRLNFGGNNSSFPAIGRGSTANFQFITADNSTWSSINCGQIAIRSDGALTAGGSSLMSVMASSQAGGLGVYFGSGVPTISAAQGSLYIRSDGSGINNRAYINNSSGSGTTWTPLVTVA